MKKKNNGLIEYLNKHAYDAFFPLLGCMSFFFSAYTKNLWFLLVTAICYILSHARVSYLVTAGSVDNKGADEIREVMGATVAIVLFVLFFVDWFF